MRFRNILSHLLAVSLGTKSPLGVARAFQPPHFLCRIDIPMYSSAERREAVRRQRLAALERYAASNSPSNENVVDPVGTGKSPLVVDLCSDSESDNQQPEKRNRRAKVDCSRESNDGNKRKASSEPNLSVGSDNFLSHQYKKRVSSSSRLLSTTSSSEASSKPVTTAMQLATWNVWFGPHNGRNPHVPQRMNALVKLLLEKDSHDKPLWFVGLQEVTEESHPHLERSLSSAGFTVVPQSNRAPYYCLLCVRSRGPNDPTVLDAGWVNFSTSCMSRGFCYVRVRLPQSENQLLVATTHLESYASKDYNGAKERPQQLQEFERYVKDEMATHPELHHAVLMGDLNWDDERRGKPPDSPMDKVFETEHWKDAWLESRPDPKATCFTYDGKANPMLSNKLQRRFDRCLFLSTSKTAHEDVRCVGTQILGTQALPGLFFDKVNPFNGSSKTYPTAPSDHFGLVVSTELGKSSV